MAYSILRQFTDGSRSVFWLCFAAIVATGWLALWHLAQMGVLAAICRPNGGAAEMPAAVFAMWLAMALVMMLPTAAPMIATYLDIAGAARDKDMSIVSPAVLAAGYASIWMAFSIVAAALQIVVPPAADPGLAGLVFIAAGAYQFSPLKQACLSKCRQPMAYFLAHWTDRPSGVYRMGLTQGLFCLGCCWALMSLAFVAGLMNIIWMAGLGILMLLEKVLPIHAPVVYGLGIGLMAAGGALIVTG
jgi:predicted metal-binding membrane protein